MKIELARFWDDPTASLAMTAYNIGILRFAAETENIIYILSKINELYQSAKKKPASTEQSKLLIDRVVYNLLRLGNTKFDFFGWPTIYGVGAERIPDIRNIEIERVHLIKSLTISINHLW